MKLSELQIITILTLRLRGESWPGIVQREELDCTAQKLRRTMKDMLFPQAKKKR